ncbi:MAG: PqqD family protein, partial [Ignavibacteria bacterium]|nr:PqqD family protein [Ignavibacteria bacterium]
MRVKNNIAVSDNGFVFNPSSGESFTVNPVGLIILNMMRKGMEHSEITSNLRNEFNVDAATAERDYFDFVEMMRQYRLMQHDDE